MTPNPGAGSKNALPPIHDIEQHPVLPGKKPIKGVIDTFDDWFKDALRHEIDNGKDGEIG